MRTYMHMYMYTHEHAHMNIQIHARSSMCTCACIRARVRTCWQHFCSTNPMHRVRHVQRPRARRPRPAAYPAAATGRAPGLHQHARREAACCVPRRPLCCATMNLLTGALSRAATLLPRVFSRAMGTRRKNPIMGRAFRGLYDGKHIMFGNQISFAGNKCQPAPLCRGALSTLTPAWRGADRGARGSPTL